MKFKNFYLIHFFSFVFLIIDFVFLIYTNEESSYSQCFVFYLLNIFGFSLFIILFHILIKYKYFIFIIIMNLFLSIHSGIINALHSHSHWDFAIFDFLIWFAIVFFLSLIIPFFLKKYYFIVTFGLSFVTLNFIVILLNFINYNFGRYVKFYFYNFNDMFSFIISAFLTFIIVNYILSFIGKNTRLKNSIFREKIENS